MKYKEYFKLKKQYNNKIFSYKNKKHLSKNFSRKDFSKTWNCNVLFTNTNFEQTNFDKSRIEHCSFINCYFKNCFINGVSIINTKFKGCIFENIVFNKCEFINSHFYNNKYEDLFYYSKNDILPSGLKITEKDYDEFISDELKNALNIAIKNTNIRCSETLFVKKSQRLSESQKSEMNKLKLEEAKKLGLGKKQMLKENAKRKKLRKQWLLTTHQDALVGKNRRLSKTSLDILLRYFGNSKNLAPRLIYASQVINSKFNNLSYLIKIMEKYEKKSTNK